MAMTLKERFEALDTNLKLDDGARSAAIEAHNKLNDLLVDAGIAKRTRLQGSFARKTMLPPLHDIDKVIELVDSLAEELKTAGGPLKAFELIRDVIADAEPGATFKVKKHAVGIVLPGQDFDFDAVPAFSDETSDTKWIEIADTEDDAWEASNTYELISTISTRNQDCEGLFVRQVRMVKQAAKAAGVDLPGLHLETFAYNAITTKMSHPVAVEAALATAAQMLLGDYTEPTGVDTISARLTDTERAVAQLAMSKLATRAAEASKLAADGQEDAAARIWSEILGDPFPAPDDTETLRGLNRGLGLGTTGLLTTQHHTPRTRPWRP
jgi:hypothetical protein